MNENISSTPVPLTSTFDSDYLGDSPPTVDADSPTTVDIGRLVLVIASFVIGIIGILGNGLVILVCIRFPLRGVTNILICNQSLIDLFSSVVFVLRYGLFSNVSLPPNPGAAEFVCKVWVSEYPLWALAVASTCNLVYLTIERYLAVFHPILYRNRLTAFKAKLFAALPWLVGMLHELPWAMGHRVRENHECSHQWWTDKIGFVIGIISPINHYVLPLLIMGFVYTRILFHLRVAAGGSVNKEMSGQHGQKRHFADRASRNVIKTLFVVSLTYLVCWGPNEVLYFYNNMGGLVDWNGVLYYYTVVSALCNMCVNPFIYAFHYQDFRAKAGALLSLFCTNHANILCCIRYKANVTANADSVKNVSSRIIHGKSSGYPDIVILSSEEVKAV